MQYSGCTSVVHSCSKMKSWLCADCLCHCLQEALLEAVDDPHKFTMGQMVGHVIAIKEGVLQHQTCRMNKAHHAAVRLDQTGGGMLDKPPLMAGVPVVKCCACGHEDCRVVGFDQTYYTGVLVTETYDLICLKCKAMTSIAWAVKMFGNPSFGIREDLE